MDKDEDKLINDGVGVKAGWSGAVEFYKILSGLRQAYLTFNFNMEIEQMFWTLKNELAHVKPFLIKGNNEIKEIDDYLKLAENYLFNNPTPSVQKRNRNLALKELYNAYEILNKLESINKMWQPTGMTTEQKIRRAF